MNRMIPWAITLAALSLAGCSSVPSFDERVRPLGPVCSDEGEPGPCPGAQVCLSGRCFEACGSDAECAAREACVEGVCVGSGEGIDGGMFDAGTPAAPCDGMCEEPDVCDIRTNECVSCFDSTQCSDDPTPLCDYAQGECIATHMGESCRPCDESADCADGMTCMLRATFTERVCLQPCSAPGECSAGFVCNTLDGVCEPALGGCTQLRRSLDQLTCESDAECVARGQSVESGTCNPANSICRAACSPDRGCPEEWTCDGTYCQPPRVVVDPPAM